MSHRVYVRKEQAQLLLAFKGDVDIAQGIVVQAQAKLNIACAAVLAGIVPDGTNVAEVMIENEQGVVVTE